MTPILHSAVDILLWHVDICCTIKLTSTAHPCKTGKVGIKIASIQNNFKIHGGFVGFVGF